MRFLGLTLACCLSGAAFAGETSISPEDVARAVQRGRVLLLEKQESLDEGDTPAAKGEWPYQGVYNENGKIPVGYRVGGTAICGTALIEASSDGADPANEAAILRATEFLLDALELPRMKAGFDSGYDVRGWGHAYALEYFLCLRRTARVPKKHDDAVEKAVRRLIDTLEKTEIKKRGGWNYARGQSADDAAPSTFMTAPTLQFLFEAKRQGFDVDGGVVDRALDALESARLDTGAFQYKIDAKRRTGEGFEDVRGSTGRSPVCESTLFLAGRGTVERIQGALDHFFEHWEWLEKRRKQSGTHVPPYMVAPYYFFYAHRYAAQAIELVPPEKRADYRQKLYQRLWQVREESGGWNDRVFPRSENYGTAMTMLSLCEPGHVPPANWTAK